MSTTVIEVMRCWCKVVIMVMVLRQGLSRGDDDDDDDEENGAGDDDNDDDGGVVAVIWRW